LDVRGCPPAEDPEEEEEEERTMRILRLELRRG
jgi:hypothetical protein